VALFDGGLLAGTRRQRDLSREQLAVLAGVSAGSLAHYEQGHAVPSINAAVALADALGVQVAAFMDGAADSLAEPSGVDSLPTWAQDYIRRLRTEAASHRTRARRSAAGTAA
jgi:transcriptional regulator with XRE-family HTH domain